jgi:hypothetical protein
MAHTALRDRGFEDAMNDRRRHRAYVTRNTEYHLRSNVCVAVRDRRTGLWLEQHRALGTRFFGSLRLLAYGVSPVYGKAVVGEALCFVRPDRDLITSPLVRIERPEKAVVDAHYPAASAA